MSGEVVRTSLLRTGFELDRDAPFSYECRACKRCCRGKHIPVNPYEVARLAEHLGTTTTAVLARDTEVGGAILRRREDDTCIYLGEHGCTVHPARPLACRLYPLGRQRTPDGHERFAELEPHPQTEGVYGRDGRVSDYLETQDVGRHMIIADRYGVLLARMIGALARQDDALAAQDEATDRLAGETATGDDNVLDLDATVARHAEVRGVPVPADVDARATMHLEALEDFVARLEG